MRIVPKGEYKGLKLDGEFVFKGLIAALIGTNGAGKSRLLEAIRDTQIDVFCEDQQITKDQIMHLPFGEIQPSFTNAFNWEQHEATLKESSALYMQYKGQYSPDGSLANNNRGMSLGRFTRVNSQIVSSAAVLASTRLGKDINDLNAQEIEDSLVLGPVLRLGSLNLTETILAYQKRVEKNDYLDFLNKKHNLTHKIWGKEEFERHFGPPPLGVFVEFLREVLGDRYYVNSPAEEANPAYIASLHRKDGTAIEMNALSSGERVLMWLCLSAYSLHTDRISSVPKLILLDEPDSALHPQMIQKLHETLGLIARKFGSRILFTTHSPTTIALAPDWEIVQVTEQRLTPIEKDDAIGALLVGVDQVSVHYSNRRQVFVESESDGRIYATSFSQLRKFGKLACTGISLAFIPAAPRLQISELRKIVLAHWRGANQIEIDALVSSINGQGNCAQVIGAVEDLVAKGSETVHGIIDWDLRNEPREYIHVLGRGLFYTIENAILNPLSLGFYLWIHHPGRVQPQHFGLPADIDAMDALGDPAICQKIVESVEKLVLGTDQVTADLECSFLNGLSVKIDERYSHMNGHALEDKIKAEGAFPFLRQFAKAGALAIDVAEKAHAHRKGALIPTALVDLFGEIQKYRRH